jgi:hypothetical protein
LHEYLKCGLYMTNIKDNSSFEGEKENVNYAHEKSAPDEYQEEITKKELIEQFENQVRYFDNFPQHEKFAFTVNADLYYFMLIILNILKKG